MLAANRRPRNKETSSNLSTSRYKCPHIFFSYISSPTQSLVCFATSLINRTTTCPTCTYFRGRAIVRTLCSVSSKQQRVTYTTNCSFIPLNSSGVYIESRITVSSELTMPTLTFVSPTWFTSLKTTKCSYVGRWHGFFLISGTRLAL